jgi:hypothetical protein
VSLEFLGIHFRVPDVPLKKSKSLKPNVELDASGFFIYLLHCNGNSVYIFLFWELRGLSPNFHIHVSVSDLYISRIGPHFSSSRKGRPIVEYIIRSQTHECGNWDRSPIFLFWEYLFQIFGILSLQCAGSCCENSKLQYFKM